MMDNLSGVKVLRLKVGEIIFKWSSKVRGMLGVVYRSRIPVEVSSSVFNMTDCVGNSWPMLSPKKSEDCDISEVDDFGLKQWKTRR
jgi:hypothetical protein